MSISGLGDQLPATIDVPVNVAHEMRAAGRAVGPVECELVIVLQVCGRYQHLLAAPGAKWFIDGARHGSVPPTRQIRLSWRLRPRPAGPRCVCAPGWAPMWPACSQRQPLAQAIRRV